MFPEEPDSTSIDDFLKENKTDVKQVKTFVDLVITSLSSPDTITVIYPALVDTVNNQWEQWHENIVAINSKDKSTQAVIKALKRKNREKTFDVVELNWKDNIT